MPVIFYTEDLFFERILIRYYIERKIIKNKGTWKGVVFLMKATSRILKCGGFDLVRSVKWISLLEGILRLLFELCSNIKSDHLSMTVHFMISVSSFLSIETLVLFFFFPWQLCFISVNTCSLGWCFTGETFTECHPEVITWEFFLLKANFFLW